MTSPLAQPVGASSAPGPCPTDARLVAEVLAVDPLGLGGVVVVAPAGPARDAWLADLLSLLPTGGPVRRVPPGTAPDRLLGGLDLVSTLALQRTVRQPGVLAEADGGVLVLAMAERAAPSLALAVGAALDAGSVRIERDGVSGSAPARFTVVALDESEAGEAPGLAAALRDRLALTVAPPPLRVGRGAPERPDAARVASARARVASVRCPDELIGAICEAAAAVGVHSLRAPVFAVRAARAIAALEGRDTVAEAHAALAAAMVLAHRIVGPGDTEAGSEDDEADRTGEDRADDGRGGAETSRGPEELHRRERIVDAVRAALPPEARRAPGGERARSAAGAGRAAASVRSASHGRCVGSRPGRVEGGARLAVLETVRAAAPWQRLRGRDHAAGPLRITRDDLRVRVLHRDARLTTLFVVDASGSSALHRMGEAKGAVELMLSDGYVRRERVALIAFRGPGAELLLPPTGSLARARRALAELPGGGATPLAAALDAAHRLAARVRAAGERPRIVVLTDGQANVDRAGGRDRARAATDALAAAGALARLRVPALLIDTSPARAGRERSGAAAAVAAVMGAEFLVLPRAGARGVHAAIGRAMPRAS